MGQIKAKTLLQRMSFGDSDKKESQHDIIQQWTDENIKKIVSETIMKNNDRPYTIENVKWEHQVMHTNGNYKMVVGFVDLMVHIKGEFYDNLQDTYYEEDRFIYIEVKTKIPVLGELIRQMRAYQAYPNHYVTYYLVISPDDRHSKKLSEQGFWFYKYQDPTLLF